MNGAFLKTICTKLSINPGHLAGAIGCSRGTVCKWMNENLLIPLKLVPLVHAYIEEKVFERDEENNQVLNMLHRRLEEPEKPKVVKGKKQPKPTQLAINAVAKPVEKHRSFFKYEPAYERPRGMKNSNFLSSRM